MTMEHIHIEHEGAVGVLIIDRPARFNSLDVETARDFRKAGLQLARDAAVRCVIVRGTNGVFCSGADLKYIRAQGSADDFGYLRPDGTAALPSFGEGFKEILEYLHSTISEIKRAPKPFIAAVDGVAAAGGFGIAMACDLVFASDDATFEWAYPKTGLTGAESSTFFLPRLVGLRDAMGLVLLNPRLSAAQAKTWRLINDVLPADGFDGQVMDIAQRIAAGPTQSYAVAKSLINQAAGVEQLDYHLDNELQHLARSADGRDFSEGLSAFFGKRPAAFDGRG
jgi:2-(1,2-epoxy-1,2-dihydrophenyl)acetyl-CoA isomerase